MIGPQRATRLAALVAEAEAIYDEAVASVAAEGKELRATVLLFSGGNDSTVLAHLFRDRASHAAHANTGVGIEETRRYVRDTCAAWGLPLLERKAHRPESNSYRAMVLERGFPGPAHHFKMYTRLKERALEGVRNELVDRPRRQRVIFLAGRRRSESQRRAEVPTRQRKGSIIWCSPLVSWTKEDMNAYRITRGDVPVNRVSDLIHMSGECLCGSFAKPNEREEITYWFPDAFDEIAELEALLADRTDIPEHAKRWGWGGDYRTLRKAQANYRAGRLCSSCEAPVAVSA